MVSEYLFARTYPFPFPAFSPIRSIYKPSSAPRSLSFFSISKSTAESIPYGPSIHKGRAPYLDAHLRQIPREPHQSRQEDNVEILNEDDFTRIFDIAGLRVPAKDCFALENRLRGHLLNWPRVRNIARVAGDDLKDDMVSLLSEKGDKNESIDSLNRRIYGKAEGDGEELSPVLYREKLARTFNSRGYVNFRNLAKISRPRKKKKEEKGKESEEENRGPGKNGFTVVEVVEDRENDMKGLLGEGFGGGRKWTGSKRLLLLDERYVHKEVDELPEAIKVLFIEGRRQSTRPSVELVKCKLTLFYDYWQMNEILGALLPKGMIVPTAFETVGHIAHLNLRDEHLPYKKLIAKVVLDKNKPRIQTVVNKIDAIHNDYRTMQLEVLAGNHSLVTKIVENGLCFQVDLAAVYWNSRLATERQRLLKSFNSKDVVCDVFSGVGPIAISAAKIVKRVYANDLNPHAIEYLERNSVLNKLDRKIEIFNMDGRRFLHAMFASEIARHITQVVMNLPNDAVEYLDVFKGIYKGRPKHGEFAFPTIHVYGFSKARDPEFDFHERIRIALSEVAVDVTMRKVRLVAPGKWMLCASFVLPRSVAFAKRTLDALH